MRLALVADTPTEFIMPYPVCPKCGTTMQLDKTTYESYEGGLTCGACFVELDIRIYHGALSYIRPLVDPALLEGIPKTPPACFRDYQAAVKCFGAGVPKAAAVMCRYALQHALQERSIGLGSAESIIQAAVRSKPPLLSKITLIRLQDTKWIGGEAAHPQPELALEIGTEGARVALDLTRIILLELFPGLLEAEARAQVEKIQAAKAARERSGPTRI